MIGTLVDLQVPLADAGQSVSYSWTYQSNSLSLTNDLFNLTISRASGKWVVLLVVS